MSGCLLVLILIILSSIILARVVVEPAYQVRALDSVLVLIFF
jgi:hypothetical protein